MRRRTISVLVVANACTAPGVSSQSGSEGSDEVSYEDGSEAELPLACGANVAAHVDPLRRLAAWDGPAGSLTSLALATDAPDRLYGCSDSEGLVSWNVRDASRPVPDGAAVGSACSHVAVDAGGESVATADERQVQLWQGGAKPTLLRSWQSEHPIESLVVAGDRVYVALGRSGVVALDFGGTSGLQVAAHLADDLSDARSLALSTEGLVVAEAAGGARVLEPANLQPKRDLEVPGVAIDVAAEGNTIAIAALDGVWVQQGEQTPQWFPSPGTAVGVATAGESLLVADWVGLRRLRVQAGIVSEGGGEPSLSEPSLHRWWDVAATDGVGFATDGAQLISLRLDSQLAPDVYVGDPRIDFVTLGAGESKTRAVVVHNTGDADLHICDIGSDIEGLTADVVRGVVAPGESLAVELTVEGRSDAALVGTVTIASNDPDEPELSIPVFANPDRIDVGEPMADFHLMGVDGRPFSSADLAGKVALLTYFATW